MLSIFLPYNAAISLLSIYPNEMKIYVQPKTCVQMLIMTLFVTVKTLSPHWIMDKQTVVFPYNGTRLTIKKDELLIQAI